MRDSVVCALRGFPNIMKLLWMKKKRNREHANSLRLPRRGKNPAESDVKSVVAIEPHLDVQSRRMARTGLHKSSGSPSYIIRYRIFLVNCGSYRYSSLVICV
ncbi:hypothetical protein TNCV_4077981 [Trichonephila clavipes]|nr:hypothetical protein TNCV_4077981 [Trichonephila clavipes]